MTTGELWQLLLPILIFVGFVAAGYILRFVLTVLISKLAQKTKASDVILGAIRTPIVVIFLIVGLVTALPQTSFVPAQIERYLPTIASVAIILIATVVAARIIKGILEYYGQTRPSMKTLVPILSKVGNILVYFIALVLILNTLGINVTALVAGMGIAGIAVAFALQETLSQFFAGMYIMTDRPIRVGDYIKLESGQEGYVIDIGWRSTKIRELPNNIITVPNSKIANSIVTNYYLPQPELSVPVQVGVSYNSDLEKVERVTIDVAKEVLREVTGGVPEFEPFIRYHTFGEFSINFTVILRAREYVDRYLLVHEFIKRLHKRYREEGIEIPFPIRTIYMKK